MTGSSHNCLVGGQMSCLECGAESAGAAQVCARCGAPISQQSFAAVDPAAGAPSGAAGWAAPAAIPASVGQQPSESAPDSEVDGFVLAGWVEATQFSTTRLRPGYDEEEVDAFLSAIRDTFLGIRKPSLTPDEIRNKQFSTTRLRPGYDEEEVDAFLDEAELRLAGQVSARYEAPAAGQESATTTSAASAAGAAGLAMQNPYVPGRGDEVPPGLRRVLQGYSWMAWGAVSCGWALLMVDAYVDNMNSTSDPRFLLASIAPGVLAAILFGQHIRWSRFLRRPRDARGATVAACQDGGRTLMLDVPRDGYLSGLEVRLPWWAGPETLLPGESVTFYGRADGTGRWLASSSARRLASAGTGRRRPAPRVGAETVQDVPHLPAGQRAERRYLQCGPQVIAGLGFAAAVTATLIAWVPPLTGHLGPGQLRTGACLTGTNLGLGGQNPWPYMFTPVPCTGPHLAEVFFAGNAWRKSLTAYPGYNAISDQGYARCLTAFSAYDGTDNSISSFTIDDIEPYSSDDWGSGDRWLVCLAYESTDQYPGGAPVNYSIKGSQQ
jgi:DivIVA domain-containing protein